jgi:hypothetical protein
MGNCTMQAVDLGVGEFPFKIVLNLAHCITKNLILVSIIRSLASVVLHLS